MRIMRPNDNLGPPKSTLQMRGECLKCFRHVAVAEVPGIYSSLEHPTVIFFSVSHEPCVLLRGEELVLSDMAVPMQVVVGSLLQVFQLLNDFTPARLRKIESC